jgi:hypothetical protein
VHSGKIVFADGGGGLHPPDFHLDANLISLKANAKIELSKKSPTRAPGRSGEPWRRLPAGVPQPYPQRLWIRKKLPMRHRFTRYSCTR